MPAATTIVLADATPANHTFSPLSTDGGVALLEDRDSTTSAGFKTLLLTLKKANGARSTNRVNIRLNVPYEQTIDGAVSIRSVARLSADVVIPDDMTGTERDHFAALVKNAFANAIVTGYIADLDPLY